MESHLPSHQSQELSHLVPGEHLRVSAFSLTASHPAGDLPESSQTGVDVGALRPS